MTNNVPTLSLDTTSLLTAIPGLLGFLPEQSLVVIAFDADSSIAVTARHDLLLDRAGDPTSDMHATIATIGQVCERDGVMGVVVAIVDDRYPEFSPVYRRVCAQVDTVLREAGVPDGVCAGFAVSRFAAGEPWHALWWDLGGPGPRGAHRCDPAEAGFGWGVLDDPQASPVALERSLRTGRVVLASRAEIADSLTPVAHCTDAGCDGKRRSPRRATTPTAEAKLLRKALRLLTGPAAPEMTCATVSLLGRAVTTLGVRDALLALAGGEHRFTAEAAWRELARRSRGKVRASAATMLAHLYYLGGEGAYAGVALDVALTECPDWRLAGLLNSALVGGVHPSMLWEILGESYAAAAGLGVDLPTLSPYRSI
ncbi:DUF4192 domain-containing protein [Gordonia crocea]|uniref:DUF4192 domain-containing protein n=1 Tax=Gordonia crocea TaxID=589162 RepID=A0A7I9UY89_9ACTN|nr:DUF4192 domain-containing protein [Gordonia crocea]GED98148.1 hypothetical protein nbrc107697_21870 [Gordonia crocea]